jgi:hypothetical protein
MFGSASKAQADGAMGVEFLGQITEQEVCDCSHRRGAVRCCIDASRQA